MNKLQSSLCFVWDHWHSSGAGPSHAVLHILCDMFHMKIALNTWTHCSMLSNSMHCNRAINKADALLCALWVCIVDKAPFFCSQLVLLLLAATEVVVEFAAVPYGAKLIRRMAIVRLGGRPSAGYRHRTGTFFSTNVMML